MMLLEDRIYYHTPAIVKAIADFLSTVTDEEFIKAFDPEEMNREGVYPSGAWNRDNKPSGLYNAPDILNEFQLLKSFFIRISTGDNYCVCHIG
ncbi:YfbM family protein [Hymenobacter sp. 5516J-16]|uniref:DUF1877 family protein n=1 Tax=Hymenobacter sp. 5516J-16 TaxID=2932253 RepID=UPI001FD49DDA|nr:DUF1877 family protein [Hymenobacter sp. 5516J-16]UOQ77209.1 YfbM family protein [Hymenobacter sp. 5516J-16]